MSKSQVKRIKTRIENAYKTETDLGVYEEKPFKFWAYGYITQASDLHVITLLEQSDLFDWVHEVTK